jgi:hypothetical protein
MASTEVAQSDAIGWAARFGLVAKGVPYVLVAWLALRVAFGDRSSTPDRNSALRVLAGETGGKLVLIALAVGFVGYAIWRFAEAILDRNDDKWPKRLGALGKGVLYLGIAYTTVKILTGTGSSTNEKQETADAFACRLGASSCSPSARASPLRRCGTGIAASRGRS